MIEWEDVLALACERWGAHNMQLARLDIAGSAYLPALTIIEDAAWTLAQRGTWEEPDEACFVALRACHLARRERFEYGEQPSELAAWFISDLQAAHWTLMPQADCPCGATYKLLPAPVAKPQFCHDDGGPVLGARAACACGRRLGDLDTGAPGQLRLDVVTP